ncbi:acetyl/propionyl/methylcrotonyl-CoA carboxylase subunit alpha [Acidobacteria bacterium AB60]|nr:acetyl/propionyl/methylcrotonyl-CoA carboxylase subunit alpha [Acidobacteria bacterium AB60]
MFDRILIANRGEIACRIISTCRRMGIRTIAVYSDADANSRHVRLADMAIRIGPAPALESYLSVEHVLEAAKAGGAQAIHPGYGFLAENADFAEACAQAGIVFIGPSPAAIRAMGSKAAAKRLMREAGVPMTPGYDGAEQDPEFLEEQARTIGYPVMIKANAGGGGKGMRRVDQADQFQAALSSCKREAAAAFGDDSVLIERCLVEPRHVEVQVFGDSQGNVVSIFERDCSVQRRNQKVIEEAPAPLITAELRKALGEAGRSAARAVGYAGAGTVEFLVDHGGNFYFMEMNTRLQVEHPVTEMITGLDLVEWQIRVAAGEPLPLRQQDLAMRGHAIEVRIYAEDPAHDFLPSIGKLVHLQYPCPTEHIRIETGVEKSDSITPFYDPMIAKLIVWDQTRELALQRMTGALTGCQIVGVANNVGFLQRLITSPSFTQPRLDTSLIERERNWIGLEESDPNATVFAIAALAALLRERSNAIVAAAVSPWGLSDGWRLNGGFARPLIFRYKDKPTTVNVAYSGQKYRMSIGDWTCEADGSLEGNGTLSASLGWERIRATVIEFSGKHHVFVRDQRFVFMLDDPLDVEAEHRAAESSFRAPMPGRIVALSVAPGERVQPGAALMILEAMKMECTVHAPSAGVVEAFNFAVGDQVNEGVQLLTFKRDEANES